MLRLAGISNVREDLGRFLDTRDVRTFLKKTGMDGFELLLYGTDNADILPKESICGVHLNYYPSWVPFWLGDEERLVEEFGSIDAAKEAIGAENKTEFVTHYRQQMKFAESRGAKYVVFHVSQSALQETVSYRFHYTDEQVVDTALDVINAVLEGRDRGLLFLTENLWWPGFSFTSPDITARLMNGIRYKNKGIMLDIGHLMHTNRNLAVYGDALRYIEAMLDVHADLCRYIKGVHLHQTFSGEHVEKMLSRNILLEGDYTQRLMVSFAQIMQIDAHEPFLHPGIARLIQRIAPDYLVYEFMTMNRDQHEKSLLLQNEFLGEKENRLV